MQRRMGKEFWVLVSVLIAGMIVLNWPVLVRGLHFWLG